MAWHERAIALKAISFAFVGVINTAHRFQHFLDHRASYLGWPLVPANVLAWLVAVSFSYAMNSFTTFGPESGRILRWRDYATFAASGVAGMVGSTATLFGSVLCLAGAGGEAAVDPGELRDQFFALAFRGIPQAPPRGTMLTRIS